MFSVSKSATRKDFYINREKHCDGTSNEWTSYLDINDGSAMANNDFIANNDCNESASTSFETDHHEKITSPIICDASVQTNLILERKIRKKDFAFL